MLQVLDLYLLVLHPMLLLLPSLSSIQHHSSIYPHLMASWTEFLRIVFRVLFSSHICFCGYHFIRYPQNFWRPWNFFRITCKGPKGRQEHFVHTTAYQHPALPCLTSPVRKRVLLFMEESPQVPAALTAPMLAMWLLDKTGHDSSSLFSPLSLQKQRRVSSELCQVMPAVAVEDVQNRVRHTVCLSQMEVSNFVQSCACQSSGVCAYAN